VEQNFETMWRMAKVAGGIDATVKFIETVIEKLPTFTFRKHRREGNADPGFGGACAVGTGGDVRDLLADFHYASTGSVLTVRI
jgi:hypothetical protein